MTSDPIEMWNLADYAPTAQRLEPVADTIIDTVTRALLPPAVAVDVGAGHGQLATRLAAGGYRTFAQEPSRRMRQVGEARTGTGVGWLATTAEETGLADASVDVATSSFALMFADPQRGPQEIARILRPHGLLVMTAWAPRGFLHRMTTAMLTVLPRMAAAPHLGWGDPSVAQARLEPYFHDIAVERHELPWRFASVTDGMAFYHHGSPAHAAAFAMAGDQRAALDARLRQHLHDDTSADGSIDTTTEYLLISARRGPTP
ncbi:class I SAM-dependent methyltransferase [Actinocatenispora comari]|jgi:SAM-dependent methyltransferase|uniref:SAM-dependent methyltransferase n=1 Tax=Actinocatenispora comari TaxID=2807577 RepID=A0A8J4A932_9ACTN|nr:class I SAM-dependent methyltransferase [Actinocatenispora comari]GIL25362.1 SAM-dependent methyltransferase [Actinocatenispora comari]